jgi:hypothetical protein
MSTIDSLNDMIALNFIYLPLVSMVIYVIWFLVVGSGLKSIWYISLGIPGAIALILLVIEYIFFAPHGYVMPVGIFFLLFPGYIFPPIVMILHIVTFSKTAVPSKGTYLLAIPIILMYAVTSLAYAAIRLR